MGNIAQPTSIVYNENPKLFKIHKKSFSVHSTFVVATRDGTINGYNFDIDPDNAIMMIDNFSQDSVYYWIRTR